jgi:NitT/TauT family transport system ATP-binding protein/sulfonate transport system ATP-binding protein
MQPRPGRIKRIVDVPLPRSRDRGSRAFAAIKDDVLGEFVASPRMALFDPPSERMPLLSDLRFSI